MISRHTHTHTHQVEAAENNREENKDIVEAMMVASIQKATSIFNLIILRDCPSVGTELAQEGRCATL